MPEFKLKDRDGKEQTYNRDVITVPGTNGEKLPFSYGEAQSEVPIELDFTDGDMEVTAGNGTLVKSAVIKKPTDLEPENVRYGKNIGGVVGTFLVDAEEITVDGDTELNFSEGNFVIKPTDETKVISKVTLTPPSALVPENIVEGETVAGIEGAHGLNLAFGETAPADKNKIWAKIATIPFHVTVSSEAPAFDVLTDYSIGVGKAEPMLATAAGKVYVFADSYIGRVDVENKTITQINITVPLTSFFYSAVEGVGDNIYIFGGYSNSAFLDSIYRFDTTTETLTLLPAKLPTPTRWMGSAVCNDKVYLIGGSSASAILNTINVFDPSTETLTTLSKRMMVALDDPACAANGGVIWIFNGYNNGAKRSTYCFDPIKNTYMQYTSSGHSTSAASYRTVACSWLGNIYLFGGFNASNAVLTSIQRFNRATPSMSTLSAVLPGAAICGSCVIYNAYSLLFTCGDVIYELKPFSLELLEAQVQVGVTDYPVELYKNKKSSIQLGVEKIYIGGLGDVAETYTDEVLYKQENGDYWQSVTTGEIVMDGSYSCAEVTSATTLTASVSCKVGDLVIAAIATRDTLSLSSGWALVSTSGVNSNDTTNGQRLSFAYMFATSTTASITVTQASAQRLYINMVALTGATGIIDNGYHYDNNENGDTHSITLEKPSGLVLWATTAPQASTPNVWKVDNASPTIQLGTDTQARLVIVLDQSEAETVTFSQPTGSTIIAGSLTVEGIDKFYW